MTTISTNRRDPARGQPPAKVSLPAEPDRNCQLCPRLAAFREQAREREPDWFNAPVPSFGEPDAELLIVGLAPGLQGANRTGRPFTGDYAGDLLYATLLEYGFAKGTYQARPDDGLTLIDCRISNAVRCVPPQNKPMPSEINTCRAFLSATIAAMPRLRAVVALGRIAHDSLLKVLNLRGAAAPFAHGAIHQAGTIRLYDSYHCSRYNTNTGVLTPKMFRDLFAKVRAELNEGREGR
ncbi:MAG TPA: uracil-DNA glycosylase [Bradyrhizobium sp.]|nr:uracil-DNA glycosylase [Bradyrhizobium sp.]